MKLLVKRLFQEIFVPVLKIAGNGGGLRAKPADIVGHLPSPEHLHPYEIPNPVEASMYPHSPRWDWENQRNVVHV